MFEVIAQLDGNGAYDMRYRHTVHINRATSKAYVVMDEFRGTEQLRGGMYRPRRYTVSLSTARKVAAFFEGPENWEMWLSRVDKVREALPAKSFPHHAKSRGM